MLRVVLQVIAGAGAVWSIYTFLTLQRAMNRRRYARRFASGQRCCDRQINLAVSNGVLGWHEYRRGQQGDQL
jgi:hypothetical protein